MKPAGRRQHGYALLLTLVLLMIAAVALASVARQSTREALDAKTQAESLQRRWAETSCRATLLPRAQGLLANDKNQPERSERERSATRAEIRVSCELAGIDYDLVLTDEQAKYNPTAMGALMLDDQPLVNERKLIAAVRELARLDAYATRRSGPAVRLRPMIGIDRDGQVIDETQPGSNGPITGIYAGYGQLFDRVLPADLVGTGRYPGLGSQLTCWGDGRINVSRASPAVIRRTLGPVLGSEGVAELLAERNQSPGVSPSKWLEAVASATPTQRTLASAMLTESSNAHGLWVIAHGQTRSWYAFSARVYTPIEQLEARREAQIALSPGSTGLLDPEPLPDPVQYYEYAW